MQYEARGMLDDQIDKEFILMHGSRVVADYPDDLSSDILTALATERMEGHLIGMYVMWCIANDDDLSDDMSDTVTELMAKHRGGVETMIEELIDQMSEDERSTSENGTSTETTDVFDL